MSSVKYTQLGCLTCKRCGQCLLDVLSDEAGVLFARVKGVGLSMWFKVGAAPATMACSCGKSYHLRSGDRSWADKCQPSVPSI